MFRVTTNGALTSLVSFSGTNGARPGGLTLGNDGNFYGTTLGGGITNATYPIGMGTVFRVTTNGTLTTLVTFSGANGATPLARLTGGNDGNLYGTTGYGGDTSQGTVFRLLLPSVGPPRLTLQLSSGSLLLSLYGMLSNNFIVQYTANLEDTNWMHLCSVTNLSASPYQFLDPAGAGQSARFYRAFMQ